MEFRDNLMWLRREKGWSQEQLGEKLSVSRQTVSKWELGDTTPELAKLMELSRIFDKTIDQLVGNTPLDEPPAQEKIVYIDRRTFEYKSKRTVFGIPLVHINVGRGLNRAKGFIAIGNIACGVVSFGGVAAGFFALGGVSLGLFAIGGLAVGLLLAIGAFAAGALAVGGISLGIFAIGGISFGVYAAGGAAFALKIAAGGYASGHIAIGEVTSDSYISFLAKDGIDGEIIRQTIYQEFPKTWSVIADAFSSGIWSK